MYYRLYTHPPMCVWWYAVLAVVVIGKYCMTNTKTHCTQPVLPRRVYHCYFWHPYVTKFTT